MPNFVKENMVGELEAFLNKADSFVVMRYSGLNSNELNELRKALHGVGGNFKVVKNRLATIVMHEEPLCSLLKYIDGPTGFVLLPEDILPSLKVLTDFSGEHAGLKLKGGLVQSTIVGEDEIIGIASLPGREQLVGRLIGILASPVARLINVVSSPISTLVGSLDKIREKFGGDNDDREKGNR